MLEALVGEVVVMEGPKETFWFESCGPTADSKRAVSAEGVRGPEDADLTGGDSERMDSKMVEKMARSRSVMVE